MTSGIDEFAAASEAASGNVGTQNGNTPASAPAVAGPAMEFDDPFATGDQIKSGGGGQWDPRIPFEEIAGRTVLMIPREFRFDAPNPFPGQEGNKREEFRVDLVILDGGPLEFDVLDREASTDTNKVYKTETISTFPHMAKLQSVAQGSLIGKLKGLTGLTANETKNYTWQVGATQLYLGVMSYAPYAAAERKGATIDTVTATVKQWIDRGRKGTKPEYTWILDYRPDVLTQERRKLALKWWSENKNAL
jgi:hypothetical protein